MKHHIQFIVLGLVLIFCAGCVEDNPKEGANQQQVTAVKPKNDVTENLNISFLLDLSDRIDPKKYPNEAMEYFERDAAYITSVSEAFDMHLRNKRVRAMNEKIQVFFDPEPKNPNINSISNQLKFHITRENASIELLDKIKSTYASKPKEIYELAISDNKYVGSDTWRFFKTKVKDFCIEENHRNILIILTDGYIFHKDTQMKEENKTTYLIPQTIRRNKLNTADWQSRMVEKEYGIIPANSDISDLEVLVLGINPDKKNSYEEEVIMQYWSDWFDAMDIKRYELKTAGLPANMDKLIKNFILI
ncbi:hypothetical protein MG296_11090 [Flavobacteriaceae bacterium TK19130]|nr:hypothetical protein [Thermobacterium salinum]